MQPIRRIITKELLVLFGLLALVSAGLAWLGINRILDQQIEVRSRQDLADLAQEIRRDLADVERVGRTAQRWWQEGALSTEDLRPAEAHLAALLEEFPAIANLVMIDGTGWGLSMSRLPDGLSSYRLDARQNSALKQYLRKQGRPMASAAWEATTYRVFERPWYRAAAHGAGPQWVGAYPFANRPVHGLSFALPLRDAQGRFQGALCADIFLDSLSKRTWAVQPTPHSLALVSDGEGKAIILPKGVDSNPAAVGESAFLTPLSPQFLPLFHGLLQRWETLGRPAKLFRVRSQGAGYTGAVQPLRGVEGVQWNLSLAVPDQDYRDPGRRVALGILAAGALASCLAFWRAVRMAQGFSAPLEALAGAAEALGSGALPALIPSDVREIRTLGEAIARAGVALEQEAELQTRLQHSQRLETVGSLTGGIAHDVNNQLAVIVGQLNLGRETLAPAHPTVARLDRAEEAAQRCARMIGSLLSFTHQAKPALQRVDLNALVRMTTELVAPLLGGRITLELDLDPGGPAVRGEAVSLEQVLMNLAVNARDAMPEGGRLRMTTRGLPGGEILLVVRDTGVGIPLANRTKIFDPFFTTKGVGKGTGLGLAMVAGIIQAHGGRLEVDSELGAFTEFRIFLKADATAPAPPAGAEIPARTGSLAGLRILVVEDEKHVLDLLEEALASRHAQVDTATNGRLGWARWQAHRYDLVLSDQRMPEMTGLELLAKIRATGSTMPVLLASGFGLEGLEGILAADPNLHILSKPFNLQKLFTLAESLRAGAAAGLSLSAAGDNGR